MNEMRSLHEFKNKLLGFSGIHKCFDPFTGNIWGMNLQKVFVETSQKYAKQQMEPEYSTCWKHPQGIPAHILVYLWGKDHF